MRILNSRRNNNGRRAEGRKDRFDVNSGVRQGSVEGPTLFNVAYQCVILEALGREPGIGVKLAGVGGFDTLRVTGGPREITVELLVFADNLCLVAGIRPRRTFKWYTANQ